MVVCHDGSGARRGHGWTYLCEEPLVVVADVHAACILQCCAVGKQRDMSERETAEKKKEERKKKGARVACAHTGARQQGDDHRVVSGRVGNPLPNLKHLIDPAEKVRIALRRRSKENKAREPDGAGCLGEMGARPSRKGCAAAVVVVRRTGGRWAGRGTGRPLR